MSNTTNCIFHYHFSYVHRYYKVVHFLIQITGITWAKISASQPSNQKFPFYLSRKQRQYNIRAKLHFDVAGVNERWCDMMMGNKEILRFICDRAPRSLRLLCRLHGVHEMNAQRAGRVCQHEKRSTDFDQIWYEYYATGGPPKHVPFNFIQWVIPTRLTYEFVRQERKYRRRLYYPHLMYGNRS